MTKVTEHEWHFQMNWETYVYPGDDLGGDKVVLSSSSSTTTLTTRGDKPVTPKPEKKAAFKSNEVELTWLLRALGGGSDSATTQSETKDDNHVVFSIDRSDADKCHTPRRNVQVEEALTALNQLSNWGNSTKSYFFNVDNIMSDSNNQQGKRAVNAQLRSKSAASLFDPVPATFSMEEKEGEDATSATLSINDIDLLLQRQTSKFNETMIETMSVVNGNKTNTMHDEKSTQLILGIHSLGMSCTSYSLLVRELENMLHEQLVAAIGKVVQPSHFAEYMNYHQRNLYNEEYRPKGFCHAVRRPGHYPEGTLSLEARDEKGDYHPVPCLVAQRKASLLESTNNEEEKGQDNEKNSVAATAPAMTFPLSAASNLTFFGDQYLHSFVVHQFSGRSPPALRLAARARQFSSFILMVGKMSGPTSFEPESAIIVKNKDDLLIPLLLETIPTPKQFRDAIESLSPEQQRFAKSFRAMQLNSTLFAMVVIQIKPQLERVLNLPFDALTKEIKLTQQLMELFIEYQIPPDLLSFSSTEDLDVTPVAAVKEHVKEIMSILEESKGGEIQDQMQRRVKQELEVGTSGFGFGGGQNLGTGSVFGGNAGSVGGGANFGGNAKNMNRRSRAAPRGGGGGGGGGRGGGHPMEMAMSAAMPPAAPPAPQMMKQQVQRMSDSSSSSPSSNTLQQQQQPQQQPQQQKQGEQVGSSTNRAADWTNIPKRMDESFEKLDTDSSLRPTIVKVEKNWDRTTQKGLLSKPIRTRNFGVQAQKTERTKTFDLLDALTRSGVMAVETGASLHVVLCATHCFDKTLMNSIVQDNINPIEKVERSSLIMASTIHRLPVAQMIKAERLNDVKKFSPMLFDNEPVALEDDA